uniref:Uncharacterized protein n=1 Tax=Romanomermis culicivorax TaxID=13658 RepID=A0A915JBL2_ROMCU
MTMINSGAATLVLILMLISTINRFPRFRPLLFAQRAADVTHEHNDDYLEFMSTIPKEQRFFTQVLTTQSKIFELGFLL